MKIVVDPAGKVLMWSDQGSPEPPAGCSLVDLTKAQENAFSVARQTPNGGLMFANGAASALPVEAVPTDSRTVAEKLQAVGIPIDDLKAALAAKA